MDIFSTHVLNRVVEHLVRPASFLLDTFFTSIQTEEQACRAAPDALRPS